MKICVRMQQYLEFFAQNSVKEIIELISKYIIP